MQRKHFISAIVIASLLSPLSWAYTGGTGEPNDPYRLTAVADWQQLMATSDDWDKHFILTADLDLQGVALNPVGSSYDPNFTGVFDGNGHIIRNAVIYLPGSDYVGLFGYLGAGGELRDLGAEDVNIIGNRYVGGLVGANGAWSSIGGTLTSCYATGQVTGDRLVGGLVGDNWDGTLTSCYATGHVTGDVFVGGLVGYNGRGTLTSCYATGQVTGDVLVGGLVGWNEEGTLTSCYATGQVSGRYDYVGGLVGDNWEGTLTCCYATGQVTGGGYVGGLVGDNWDGKLTSCYATGQVTGDERVGGLVGTNVEGTLKACYATGQVTGVDRVGGLVGYNLYATITACFWDIETSEQFTSDGGEGKTTAQMQDINTFLDAGWDFVEIWDIGENQTYPFLRTHPAGDINHDHKVNFRDLAILAENWLEGR